MAEHDYTAVLLEEIRNKIETVAGAVNVVGDRVERIEQRMEHENVAADVKVIKAAVTDSSHELIDHERRITALERVA